MSRRVVSAACVLVIAAMASPVHAHPRLDLARVAYEEADLEGATAALDEAFDVGHLERDEYLDALVLRALVASASSRDATRDDALRQIGAIDPGYVLPEEAPPSLRRRYAEIIEELGGERVAANLTVERDADHFSAQLRLTDPVRAVVSTSIVCRAGEDVFQSEGRDVFGLAPAWRSLVCVARLLGRGGTVLDELEETVAGDGSTPEDAPAATGSDEGVIIGVTLGVAGAVAAAVAIILVVVLTGDSQPAPRDGVIVPGGFM